MGLAWFKFLIIRPTAHILNQHPHGFGNSSQKKKNAVLSILERQWNNSSAKSKTMKTDSMSRIIK